MEESATLACTELSREQGFKTDNFEQFKRCEEWISCCKVPQKEKTTYVWRLCTARNVNDTRKVTSEGKKIKKWKGDTPRVVMLYRSLVLSRSRESVIPAKRLPFAREMDKFPVIKEKKTILRCPWLSLQNVKIPQGKAPELCTYQRNVIKYLSAKD